MPRLDYIVAFLGVGVLIPILNGGVPLRLGFFASLSSMDCLAENARMDPASVQDESRVGLYPIKKLETFDGGLRFLVSGAGVFESGGFAYSENGLPRVQEERDYYSHYHGNWYIWVSNQ